MKEIDFLPESYKKQRQTQVNYHRQYLIVGGLIVIMLAWSFTAGLNVVRAKAQVQEMKDISGSASPQLLQQYADLCSSADKLRKQKKVLEQIDQHVSISSVIAEVSFISGDDIVFREIDMSAESFEAETSQSTRAMTPKSNKVTALPDGQFRFRVQLKGYARNGSAVAQLIHNLELSEFFTNVVPGYSRQKEVNDIKVNEFEITCFISNYEIVENKVTQNAS